MQRGFNNQELSFFFTDLDWFFSLGQPEHWNERQCFVEAKDCTKTIVQCTSVNASAPPTPALSTNATTSCPAGFVEKRLHRDVYSVLIDGTQRSNGIANGPLCDFVVDWIDCLIVDDYEDASPLRRSVYVANETVVCLVHNELLQSTQHQPNGTTASTSSDETVLVFTGDELDENFYDPNVVQMYAILNMTTAVCDTNNVRQQHLTHY
jgi:hypothetical protein